MGRSSEPCARCGIKRYRKTPEGFLVCLNGHVLANYREEESEFVEGASFMSLRRKKKVKSVKESKTKFVYLGGRAQFHNCRCFQYVLRAQVKTLIEILALPPEFEQVVQDLWCLYLSSRDLTLESASEPENGHGQLSNVTGLCSLEDELLNGVGDDTFHDDHEAYDSDDYQPAFEHELKLERRFEKAEKERLLESGPGSFADELDFEASAEFRHRSTPADRKRSSGRSAAASSRKRRRTAVRNRLLRDDEGTDDVMDQTYDAWGWVIEAGSSEDDPVDGRNTKVSRRVQKVRAKRQWIDPAWGLKFHWTLVFCYLGCVWMRSPVALMDIIKLAQNRRIVYHNAWSIIPAKLRAPMSISMFSVFRAPYIPHPEVYHRTVANFVNFYKLRHGLLFPPLNVPLFADRFAREMVLPAEITLCALRVIQTLADKREMHSLLIKASAVEEPAGNAKRRRRRGPRHVVSIPRNLFEVGASERMPPCGVVMAVLIVLVKLVYGLDGLRRREPRERLSRSTLSRSMPEYEEWFHGFLRTSRSARRDAGEIPISYIDVPEFARENPEVYIDFCERFFGDRDGLCKKNTDKSVSAFADLASEIQPSNDDPSTPDRFSAILEETLPSSTPHVPADPNVENTPLVPGESYVHHPSFNLDARGVYPLSYDRLLAHAAQQVGLEKAKMQVIVGRVEEWMKEVRGKELVATVDDRPAAKATRS